MPEILTKHPDIVIQVLEGAGVRCGGGQKPRILKSCPSAQLCTTPNGELCVYGPTELEAMTQLSHAEICAPAGKPRAREPTASASEAGEGCATQALSPQPGAGIAALGAIAIAVGVVSRRVRRRGKNRRQRRGASARRGADGAGEH